MNILGIFRCLVKGIYFRVRCIWHDAVSCEVPRSSLSSSQRSMIFSRSTPHLRTDDQKTFQRNTHTHTQTWVIPRLLGNIMFKSQSSIWCVSGEKRSWHHSCFWGDFFLFCACGEKYSISRLRRQFFLECFLCLNHVSRKGPYCIIRTASGRVKQPIHMLGSLSQSLEKLKSSRYQCFILAGARFGCARRDLSIYASRGARQNAICINTRMQTLYMCCKYIVNVVVGGKL